MCISHKHLLVHLSSQSITKTKQGPFSCIYMPSLQIQLLPSKTTPVGVIGRSDDRRRMWLNWSK